MGTKAEVGASVSIGGPSQMRKRLMVFVVASSVALSACASGDVFDALSPSSVSLALPAHVAQDSIRVLGEADGVLYLAAKQADNDDANCLVIVEEAAPEGAVSTCVVGASANVGAPRLGEATAYFGGVPADLSTPGEQHSEWLVIVTPPALSP